MLRLIGWRAVPAIMFVSHLFAEASVMVPATNKGIFFIAAIAALVICHNIMKKEKTCCLVVRRLSHGKRQNRSLHEDECELCPDTDASSAGKNSDLADDDTTGADDTGK